MSPRLIITLLLAVLAVPLIAYSGTLNMSTYYPAPTGNYDTLNANSVGIGTVTTRDRLTIAGQNSGYASFGNPGSGCSPNYTGLSLNGQALSGCTNYNLTSSPSDTNLYINRPAGATQIHFRKANGDQMVLDTNGNLGINKFSSLGTKLEVLGDARIGNSAIAPYTYGLSIGDISTDYVPNAALGQPYRYSLTLNGSNMTSIGFHDSGTSIHSIRYSAGLFTIGADDGGGWGTASTYFADNVGIGATPVGVNKLTVLASSTNDSQDGIHLSNNTAWMKFLPGTTGAGSWNPITQDNDNAIIYYSPANPGLTIAPWTGSSQGIRMDASGNVGIAKALPTEKLDITGNIATTGTIRTAQNQTMRVGNAYMSSGGDYANFASHVWYNGTSWVADGTPGMLLQAAGQEINFWRNDGTAGGFTRIFNQAYSAGNPTAQIWGNLTMNTMGTSTGNITANGFYYPSDERLKENISPIKGALDKITQLDGVDFTWKSDKRKSIGLIAQNVEKIFPEVVTTDAEGMKSVSYPNLVAPLIEAIKEQQQQIEDLKARVAALEKK